jgi:hypothetical protein
MRSCYQHEVGILHVMRARCTIVGHHSCVSERSEVLSDIEEAINIVGTTVRRLAGRAKKQMLVEKLGHSRPIQAN